MSYSETRTKNIVGFEENWTRFYEFRLCFLSEFFIEPSRFFAGIDAAFSGMKLCDLRSSTAEWRICGCLRARYASCFAGKNAAEFPLKRANDGGFFLMILRSQSAFLPFAFSYFARYKDDWKYLNSHRKSLFIGPFMREKSRRNVSCVSRKARPAWEKNTFCRLFFWVLLTGFDAIQLRSSPLFWCSAVTKIGGKLRMSGAFSTSFLLRKWRRNTHPLPHLDDGMVRH